VRKAMAPGDFVQRHEADIVTLPRML